MKLSADCTSCIRKQVEQAIQILNQETPESSPDQNTQEKILQEVGHLLDSFPEHWTPAELSFHAMKIVLNRFGQVDPLKSFRHRSIQLGLEKIQAIRARIQSSENPLYTATLIAGIDTTLDFISPDHLDLENALNQAIEQGFARSDYESFEKEISEAGNMLYLLSEAGDLIFDRMLIEAIKNKNPDLEIIVAVNRYPLLFESVREDAVQAGLDTCAEIIDKGYDGPGTLLAQAGDEFQLAFSTSDLILSKGQIHYQTLQNRPDVIYFLLQAKCLWVAESLQVAQGQCVLIRSY